MASKEMKSMLAAATCEAEELIMVIKYCLPPEHVILWHGTDDILKMLRDGGILSYDSRVQIGNLLRAQKLFTLTRNRTNNKCWFSFYENMEFDVPKEQINAFKGDDRSRPTIAPDYFKNLGINFKFIKMSKGQTATNTTTTKTATTTTATIANRTTTAVNNNNNNNTTNTTAHVNNNKNDKNNKSKQNTSCRPVIPNAETGFMISRLDIVDDIAKAAADHRKHCPCELIKKQRKSGFEVFFDFECNYRGCKKKYHIRSGPKPTEETSATKTPKRSGPKVNQLNTIVTGAAHKAAVPVKHILDWCDDVGCVSPSEKGLFKMMEKRKAAVKTVAEEVLRANRREHVAAVKKRFGDKHVIKHTDADGKIHNITHGAACADGAGDKRAYNHRITGSMHSTVVFSMLTNRVIAVRHDQVSCGLCDRQMTKLLKSNKRADEITDEDLKHDGPCARNSKYDPAVAEEHALEHIARDLLVDPTTGKLRPDDEAILVDCFISDGDTKGPKRFIATQASIVTEFNEIAIYLPDIGHFIKCISNALHKVASNHSTLRGVSLLESARIKSICSDVTGILKDYGKEYKRIKAKSDSDDDLNQQLKESREKVMKRIKAIVPHHCNDHSGCSINDCYVIKKQRERINSHRVMHPDSQLTDEQIIEEAAEDIAMSHAKNGRFRGKHMSMGKDGQAVVMKEITDRLDFDSIDRVATISSSNRCENFFGVVAKYTHGKRLYFGRSDSFEVIQLYVAMTINNDTAVIEDKIRKILGVSFDSSIREAAYKNRTQLENYQRENKRSAEVIERRKLSKIASTKKAAKNSKAPRRHLLDIVFLFISYSFYEREPTASFVAMQV